MCNQRAEDNALRRSLELNPFTICGEVAGEYLVDSTSRPGLTHTVKLGQDFQSSTCDCEAGQRQTPCIHVASAFIYVACGLSCIPADREQFKRTFCPSPCGKAA